MYFVTFLLCDKEQNPAEKLQIHPEKCLKDQLPPFSPEPPSISRRRAQERFPLIWRRCWFKHSAPKIERIRTYGYETPEEATLNNNHEKKQTSLGKKIPQLHCYWLRSSSFSDESHFLVQGNRSEHVCRSIVDLLSIYLLNVICRYIVLMSATLINLLNIFPKKMFWVVLATTGSEYFCRLEEWRIQRNTWRFWRKRWQLIFQTLFRMDLEFFSRILLLVTKQKSNEIHEQNEIQGTGLARMFPWLNPTENLWSIIKLRLRMKTVQQKQSL